MPAGFEHEFMLFHEGVCLGIVRTRPPNRLVAWSVPLETLSTVQDALKGFWAVEVINWIEKESQKPA